MLAMAVNQSTVRCTWSSVPHVQHYTIFGCRSQLQDGLCKVGAGFETLVENLSLIILIVVRPVSFLQYFRHHCFSDSQHIQPVISRPQLSLKEVG